MRKFLLFILFLNLYCSYSQSYISQRKAIEDINFYNSSLEAIHYNPYLHISKAEYLKKADSIKNEIGDSTELKSFILKLYALTSSLQDGHANPSIPISLRPELLKKQFLPFSLIQDDKGYVYLKDKAVENPIPAGSRIIKINQVNLDDFIKEATGYTGGLHEYKKQVSQILLPYYLFLHNVTAPFTVEYLSSKKQLVKTVISEGVDFRTAFNLSAPNSNKPPYSFKIINNKVGYIDFISMNGNYQDFDKFLDSAFTVVRTNNIKTLAVDLRKNSGGNSLLGELLLSYITRKDFSLMGERYWKISEQYKDYLRARGDTTNEYLTKENGSIWRVGKCGAKKQKFRVDTVFKGKVFFLTGPFTFSSANMLADGVKQYKLATIIGEPTGESTNDFGEAYSIELPNTKVKVQVTTSYDVGVDCKKNHSLPVIPDVVIRTTVKDKIRNLDPVLDYVIKN